jgi:hypothetical protein
MKEKWKGFLLDYSFFRHWGEREISVRVIKANSNCLRPVSVDAPCDDV